MHIIPLYHDKLALHTKRENFEVVKSKLVWGVALRHRNIIARTNKVDVCAFYMVKERSGEESAIGGIFSIASEPFEDISDIFPSKRFSDKVYPYRVLLKTIKFLNPQSHSSFIMT
jgi:predicted RNA-binding protein